MANVLLDDEQFCDAVQEQFASLYDAKISEQINEVGDDLLEIGDIKKGYDELKVLCPIFWKIFELALTPFPSH